MGKSQATNEIAGVRVAAGEVRECAPAAAKISGVGTVCNGRSRVRTSLRYTTRESEGEREQLATLCRLAEASGCVEALKATYGEESPLFGYVTDDSRQILLDLIPINQDSDLLEIGCGLGQFTASLARRCEHVSAMDVVKEQAVFTDLRCREAGCDNVDVVAGGDDCTLPYPDETFDGVVLNLVLEWCGMRKPHLPLVESQRRMLSEIHRVLKPGGFAFVATKNRFALRLLLGKRDGHAHNMRFGHALPRVVMNTLLGMQGHDRPSGMLHSHCGFKRLLRESGFSTIEPYWAAPDMRRPQRYIPGNVKAIRDARREGGFAQARGRIIGRLMPFVPAPLVPHLAHGNVAIAYK